VIPSWVTEQHRADQPDDRKRSGEERLPLSADWRNDQRMADQTEQVSTSGLVDTKQQPGPTKRRQYSEALKRQMVAETQAPGASVSIVARRHDVNSNQLFRWRRQLLPKAVVESGAMVPVEIAPDLGRPRRPDRVASSRSCLAVGRGFAYAARSARRRCGR
jgi:transposase-like protein